MSQNHPMPGQTVNGATVIASVVYNDDNPNFMQYLLLTLHTDKPYYRVQVVSQIGNKFDVLGHETFVNIVPAVAAYVDSGGNF